jgi:DNA invertase Pin-like site-specific DNA recombinase
MLGCDPSRSLPAAIAATFAEAERDRIHERIAQVKRDQKARGRFLGGTAPWGWRKGADGSLEPVPEQSSECGRIRLIL